MQSHHFKSVREFYPYYLIRHRELRCRVLHFAGTALVIALFSTALATQTWWLIPAMPVAGYSFAWAGHFLFEENKPAAFSYPLYSLTCDLIMFWHIVTGQIGDKVRQAEKSYPQFCD